MDKKFPQSWKISSGSDGMTGSFLMSEFIILNVALILISVDGKLFDSLWESRKKTMSWSHNPKSLSWKMKMIKDSKIPLQKQKYWNILQLKIKQTFVFKYLSFGKKYSNIYSNISDKFYLNWTILDILRSPADGLLKDDKDV